MDFAVKSNEKSSKWLKFYMDVHILDAVMEIIGYFSFGIHLEKIFICLVAMHVQSHSVNCECMFDYAA